MIFLRFLPIPLIFIKKKLLCGEVHKYEMEIKPPQKLGGPFILRK